MARVYLLIDPTNDSHFYIGVTVRELKVRLSQHIHSKSSKLKYAFFESLKNLGYKPIIKVIDIVPQTEAEQKERDWYFHLNESGVTFTNRKIF